MDQASVSTEPGLEIGPVNCGKLLNCNEFMKYVVQIVNKERRSLKKNYYYCYYYYLSDFKSVRANLGELEPSPNYHASSGPGEKLSSGINYQDLMRVYT